MAKEKERIKKELLKIDEAVKNVFDKADARVGSRWCGGLIKWQKPFDLLTKS